VIRKYKKCSYELWTSREVVLPRGVEVDQESDQLVGEAANGRRAPPEQVLP
jgi:hypothetical protein